MPDMCSPTSLFCRENYRDTLPRIPAITHLSFPLVFYLLIEIWKINKFSNETYFVKINLCLIFVSALTAYDSSGVCLLATLLLAILRC